MTDWPTYEGPTYEGRLFADRQEGAIDFRSPLEPDDEPDLMDDIHYVEVRPRTDAEGDAVVVLACTCEWAMAVTDTMGGDDFVTPWEIMDLARGHYLALVAGHKISASEIQHYGLAGCLDPGVIVFERM